MNRSGLFVLGLLIFSPDCFGQSTPGDSQTLQALLSEVRQLRQDLQTTTIAGQRAQILIYRLQGQEAAVARASQRLDEARDKLARIQDERKHRLRVLKLIHSDGIEQVYELGAHRPKITPEDIELTHRLWLDLAREYFNLRL